MPRPRTYDASHRADLIRHAADLIAQDGVEALSLRQVAAAAGASTTAIYSLVGSKAELVAAVAEEAQRSFVQAQRAAIAGEDPAWDLRTLGEAYRRWAVAHPSLYAVMFGGRVPPPGDPCETGGMAPLLEVVGRLHGAGRLVGGDVAAASLAIWAAVHGMVALELALWPDQSAEVLEASYGLVLDAVQRAWVSSAP